MSEESIRFGFLGKVKESKSVDLVSMRLQRGILVILVKIEEILGAQEGSAKEGSINSNPKVSMRLTDGIIEESRCRRKETRISG